jgi:biotin transport system substrate-specific component
VRYAILAALLTALTCIGGLLKIPLPGYPVAFTMQTFFVVGASFLLPPVWAFASQGVYIALGLLGLPVFASGGGLGYVFQPSFGFLVGFAVSAPVLSLLLRRAHVLDSKLTFRRAALAFALSLVSMVIIYGLGVPYMYLAVNVFSASKISLWYAVLYGCLFFLPFDLLKFALASYIGLLVSSRIGRNTL